MKKLALILVLSLSTTITSASDFSQQTLADSTVQTVARVVAGMILASSNASTVATSEQRKIEAQMIQNDIQEYSQSGLVSVYLASKIDLVRAVNADLSIEESIDVLVVATESILN